MDYRSSTGLRRWTPEFGQLAPREHERLWEQHSELRREIEQTRDHLIEYADVLAEASGVSGLHD